MYETDLSTVASSVCIRQHAQEALLENIPEEELSVRNKSINSIRNTVSQHRLLSHPIIELMENKGISKDNYIKILLDFRFLVASFTDLLFSAAVLCKQLEQKLGDGLKMQSRFLLMLNIIDEMGFFLNLQNLHKSSSIHSHYLLFEKLLKKITTEDVVSSFSQTKQCKAIIDLWDESSNDCLLSVLSCLISTEMIALHISPPLKKNAEIFECLSFQDGYFHVHGSSNDDTKVAADDFHENDLWLLSTIALVDCRESYFQEKILSSMDAWALFWDEKYRLATDTL